jgi:hypothetical protein
MGKGKSIKASLPGPQPREVATTKTINTPVSLSYRYFAAGGSYCLSHCTKNDVRASMDCFRMLTTKSWAEVLQSGGKHGAKAGLGYTPYEDHAIKGARRPPELSPDVGIVGVRATQKMRIFGAYMNHVFYIIWFDPDHGIVPA